MWLILSAKYGLVEPNQLIEPCIIGDAQGEVHRGAQRFGLMEVVQELQPHCSAGTSVVFLAGEKYREFLAPALIELGCRVEVPMENLAIGKQLHWLSVHGVMIPEGLARRERCALF